MPRVLATQSHVVHGYVGNKAATFPLQCAGWDVDCINTVQFSNHTGYGMDKVFGSTVSGSDLESIFKGILEFAEGEECIYDALLSGYQPNKDSVQMMGRYYQRIKGSKPGILWLLDPVMGDEGQLYVDENVIPEYKILIESGKIDVLTPNQFELEVLCGQKITNMQQLTTAIMDLQKHVPVIIVTSVSSSIFNDRDHIYCVASMKGGEPLYYKVPVIQSYFTGVGDIFSAILLSRLHDMIIKNRDSFSHEINHVLNVVHRVLEATVSYSPDRTVSKIGCAAAMKKMELRIVESRDDFESARELQPMRNFLLDNMPH